MNGKTAIFAGSFDPFTRGHEAIVTEALRLFDHVVIAIGNNTAKRSLMSVENRKRLIDDLYAGDKRVECRIYEGLTTDFARKAGASAIIRGVRNTVDFEYERTLADINRRLMPELVTVVLMTPPAVADISSSVVRELLQFSHSVDGLMPEGVTIENYL